MATRLKMKAKRSLKNDDKGRVKSMDECDTAVLTKPVATNINNLLKILKLYQNTTDEIRQYLTSECDILYECRVCRSIFRSLSNFILHKRKFCQEKFSYFTCNKWPNNDDDYLDIIQTEMGESETNKKGNEDAKLPKKSLNSIIDDLTQKKQIDIEIEQMFSIEHKENQGSDLNTKINKLDLEYVEGSNCSVFQTATQDLCRNRTETMKREIMEIHRLTEGQTAVIGPDGKVASQKPVSGLKVLDKTENTTLTCPKCNITFSTRKTLLSHIKYKHESERVVYPCLECSETFATVWSVYRHLYNIHHKTLPEVRKMRSRIKAKPIQNVEVSLDNKNKEHIDISINDQQKIDEENQAWMDNFESDNDIQMCGGCGRRFERKAALNSHSQTCQKRITARNIINVNKQKRTAALEEKNIDKKNSSKLVKLDLDTEKKVPEKQKLNVAKRRKIGIQIRYDYNKAVEKNVPSPAAGSNISEDNDSKKTSPEMNNEKCKNSPNASQCGNNKTVEINSTKLNYETEQNKLNYIEEPDLLEAEVVSIPSSNSSPNKDVQDPLSIRDMQSDSDCEIEEILGSDEHSQQSKYFNYESIDSDSDNGDNNEQYKLSNINESTLKLIKLINSDISEDNSKRTLDSKMAKHVNMKKLKCIPCDIKFGNVSKLRHHMASHFNWHRFRCDICTFKAYDKIDVFDHIKSNHNILDFEKVEVVILQIPDWETVELSSEEFIIKPGIEIIPAVKSLKVTEEKKSRECLSDNAVSDNCIVIEPADVTNEKPIKRHSPLKKKKIKVLKFNKKREHITADTVQKDPLGDIQPSEAQPESRSSKMSNIQDPELKKMVYEVIFGDVSLTKTRVSSNNVTGEEKDNVHIVPNDVSNVVSRPVRNRVKPLNKDFIYDLHEFKEHHKTVLVSNNSRKAFPLVNSISESLKRSTFY